MTAARDRLAAMRTPAPVDLPRKHFTGYILHRLRAKMGSDREITIEPVVENAMHGLHQARVRLSDDPTVYRLILAPADAPLTYRGELIDNAFAEPLGTG